MFQSQYTPSKLLKQASQGAGQVVESILKIDHFYSQQEVNEAKLKTQEMYNEFEKIASRNDDPQTYLSRFDEYSTQYYEKFIAPGLKRERSQREASQMYAFQNAQYKKNLFQKQVHDTADQALKKFETNTQKALNTYISTGNLQEGRNFIETQIKSLRSTIANSMLPDEALEQIKDNHLMILETESFKRSAFAQFNENQTDIEKTTNWIKKNSDYNVSPEFKEKLTDDVRHEYQVMRSVWSYEANDDFRKRLYANKKITYAMITKEKRFSTEDKRWWSNYINTVGDDTKQRLLGIKSGENDDEKQQVLGDIETLTANPYLFEDSKTYPEYVNLLRQAEMKGFLDAGTMKKYLTDHLSIVNNANANLYTAYENIDSYISDNKKLTKKDANELKYSTRRWLEKNPDASIDETKKYVFNQIRPKVLKLKKKKGFFGSVEFDPQYNDSGKARNTFDYSEELRIMIQNGDSIGIESTNYSALNALLVSDQTYLKTQDYWKDTINFDKTRQDKYGMPIFKTKDGKDVRIGVVDQNGFRDELIQVWDQDRRNWIAVELVDSTLSDQIMFDRYVGESPLRGEIEKRYAEHKKKADEKPDEYISITGFGPHRSMAKNILDHSIKEVTNEKKTKSFEVGF